MVQAAHELLSAADALIHYNGKAFDVKHLQREFLLAELPPAAPHVDIDLLRTVRTQFRFPSNKLTHVSEALGIGKKTPHTGFDLWRDCMMGNDKAWALMKKYNIQDVRLTEELYDRLLPWIPNHPSVTVFDDRPDACPQCGKGPMIAHGLRRSKTMVYKRFQCRECGAWARSRVSEPVARPDYV
jgi:DNA polymerase III epsilon subunit-like protein